MRSSWSQGSVAWYPGNEPCYRGDASKMATQTVGTADRYVGETKRQLRDGFGVYKYPNSFFTYEGEWVKGKKHGHGKLLMNDGTYYEGEFFHGEIDGHGFRKFANGNTYSGQFSKGEMNGHGVMTCPDGSRYEGEFDHNQREGHGVLTDTDGAVYEGSFHKNKRHGPGSQTYSGGERYEGDFVRDIRQGHGELRYPDGTIYEGQWRNDMFNGEGTMIHASGMVYEGMWINGKPEVEATKVVVIGEQSIEVTQGTAFSIQVELRDDEDKVIAENGREIQVSAAVRYFAPTQGTSLFDLVEDMEETPFSTPFGYEVVSYPLTDMDQLPPDYDVKPSPRPSYLIAEQTIHEAGSDAASDVGRDESADPDANPTLDADNASTGTSSQHRSRSPSDAPLPEETPLPPPPNTCRSEAGGLFFKDLVLPGAPPMYRPFILMDEMDKEKGGKGGKKSRNPSAIKPAESATSTVNLEVKLETKLSTLGKHNEGKFARPGDYVIMIHDVTTPPFLGRSLQPAFITVKVTPPKHKGGGAAPGKKKSSHKHN
ncbi:MORN repeat-containing protein 1-like isoform X3 [Branchiostoma floridae x Branchiostoma belcheri]